MYWIIDKFNEEIILDHNFVIRHAITLYISVTCCSRSNCNWINIKKLMLGYPYVATFDISVVIST